MNTADRDAARRWPAIACGVAVFAFTRLRGSIPAYVELHRMLDLAGVPPAVRNLDSWLWLVCAALTGALLVRRGNPLRSLGLAGSPLQGVRFGLLAALPMIIVAWLASTGTVLDGRAAHGTLLAPFVEELFYRGLLVAVPVAVGRAPFWPVAIFSALLFGSAHVPWNDTLGWQHVPTFLVTAAGGLWYAWLLRSFGWNLWSTIVLHAAMNGAWLVFDVGGGAVGEGVLPNVGRALTIALGTLLALRRGGRATA